MALTEDHEKCTKRLVEIVVKIVKFHSSQNRTSQSTAANAFKVIKEIKDNYHFMFYYIMNELVAGLCIAFLAGGWIIFMIGRKKRKKSK